MQPEKIIIIGASAAGLAAATEAREVNNSAEIIMLTDEGYIPYYRPFLTEYIGNKLVEEKANFYLKKNNWFAERNIDIHLGERVEAIDVEKRLVKTVKTDYPYDKLVLANGSSPFVPIAEATEKSNVFAIRSYDDAKVVYDYSDNVKSVIIIGGGLLGLETAWSLVQKGIKVTIIELAARVLPRQLDPEGSQILQKTLANYNVVFISGVSAQSIIGPDQATGVELTNGDTINADMIIFSIGIRSNTWLAQNCGINVNRGIIVNEHMETSVPGIFACGDVAEYNGRTIALWMAAVSQGNVAGANAAGKKIEYQDKEYPAVLNSFGTRIYSVGKIAFAENEHYEESRSFVEEKSNYRKLFFQNNLLSGFILIGDIKDAYALSQGIGTLRLDESEK